MELEIFFGYLIMVNLMAFVMYGIDKRKARKNKWRIPEAQLLGIAVFGGALGAWAGMSVFLQLIIAIYLWGY